MNRTWCAMLLGSLFVISQVSAQSINIDFGNPGAGPASSYAAAGQAGFWNKIPATGGVDYVLKDLAGNTTAVHFSQSGAEGVLAGNDPSVTGNDATLMNDGIIAHVYGTDSCFFFTGLTPGTYDLITYAWRPSNPSLIAKSFADNTPGIELSGGAWPGQQTHNVTYGHHIVTVDQSGAMTSHSGLNSSSGQPIGAVCNGMQLRLIPATTVPTIGTYGLAGLAALLCVAAVFVLSSRIKRAHCL